MPDKDETKIRKKTAKAESKTAKKAPGAVAQPSTGKGGVSPAERSAVVAEKQLALHRWKVIFAGVSALIALVTLVVLLMNI